MNENATLMEYTGPSNPEERIRQIPFVDEADILQEEAEFDYEHEWRLMQAYCAAWSKCLEKVQAITKELYAPAIADVVREVEGAYTNILQGLPCVEIPVIAITDRSSGTVFLKNVATRLNTDDDENDTNLASVVDMYPSDCLNLTLAMKTMITGLINKSPNSEGAAKRKPTTSLASYDIQLLEAWYKVERDNHDDNSPPKLVVILHDFEQMDATVVKDLFYICSLHVPSLPFVFILSLSSPPSPSYLHLAYPRSTLSLLRIRTFVVPAGENVLSQIVEKTFFDVRFEPDIVLGPATLEYLMESFRKHDTSMDAIITALQLAHLKHFEQPLTAFIRTNPTPNDDISKAHNDLLHTILETDEFDEKLDSARNAFYARAQKLRIGFGILRCVLLAMGPSVTPVWLVEDETATSFVHEREASEAARDMKLMLKVLRGLSEDDLEAIRDMLQNFQSMQMINFLQDLYNFFEALPPKMKHEEKETRKHILNIKQATDISSDKAAEIADWLVNRLREWLKPLEELTLWDIWFTGMSPFPEDLINPAPRASIVNGLMYPQSYNASSESHDLDEEEEEEISTLPDTTILFRRYVDSGRMINVYDWFQSFALALENQRTPTTPKRKERKGRSISRSPSKRGRGRPPSVKKNKGKGKMVEEEEEEEEEEDEMDVDDPVNDEAWKMQVQARFMRALHELDYLGFIKHTGRKADHVMRTVFDIVE